MEKEKVFFDMDGVLCNYKKAYNKALLENSRQKYPQSKWGFFLELEEMPDSISAFNIIKTKFDVYILTRPSFKNVNSFTEKAQWIWNHLGYDVLENTIMSGDKSLIKGDYLIDDMTGDGQENFEGEFLQFGSDRFPDWKSILMYLMNKK